MDLEQDIRLLMELQAIDIEIHTKQELSNTLPLTCKTKEQEMYAIEESIHEIEEKIALLLKQEKKLLQLVEQDMELLREKKNHLLLLTEQKEYNTLIKEIDALEKSNRTHEEEKLLLYEELSIQQEKLDSYRNTYTIQKEDVLALKERLEPTIAQYTKECDELEKERIKLIASISAPMYARYEFIRNRISYPILTSITQGICSTCRIVLPTQMSVNVHAKQQIYTCPSCQRILYVENT